MIEVKNLSKQYGKKQNVFQALKNINLTIPDGASVAIIGKSGSGKSTLMHLMSGLDRPTEGQVLIDGHDIYGLKRHALDVFRSETVGFVFQSFFVQPSSSCFDNVSLPLEISGKTGEERKQLVSEALTLVDMADKTKQKAGTLSGGQKQRLAIARAVVNKPKIIFADEPTGNLDSVTGKLVEDLLFGFNKSNNTTLIIVTHDDELAEKCDIQVHIKDGEIMKVAGVN